MSSAQLSKESRGVEDSKQRLHQKSLWQAVNLLSQWPRVRAQCPSAPSRPASWAGRAMAHCVWVDVS